MDKHQPGSYLLFAGAYTESPSDNGVHVFGFDTHTGKAELQQSLPVENASYLSLSADRRFLYAISENGPGQVHSFGVDATDGSLQKLSTIDIDGSEPCYITVDEQNRLAFTANYASGSITVLQISADGSVSRILQTVQHSGASINPMRQDKPHVHCVALSPDQQMLFATDLGSDQVSTYAVNYDSNSPLTELPEALLSLTAGSGPRHLVFEPTGRFAYLTLEIQGALAALKYVNGSLEVLDYYPLLADGFQGKVSGGDVTVSPDGKFLYASSRGDANEILAYSIQPDGTLQLNSRVSEMIDEPRNIAIDPSGRFLLVANQNADHVSIYRRNAERGNLTYTGEKISLWAPACLKFDG